MYYTNEISSHIHVYRSKVEARYVLTRLRRLSSRFYHTPPSSSPSTVTKIKNTTRIYFRAFTSLLGTCSRSSGAMRDRPCTSLAARVFRGPLQTRRRSAGIDRWPSWYSSVPRPQVRRIGYMAIRAGWHRLSNKLTSSHDTRRPEANPRVALRPGRPHGRRTPYSRLLCEYSAIGISFALHERYTHPCESCAPQE